MATQRIKLDKRGSNILSLFEDNMTEIGALNQLAASPKDGGVYHGPDKDVRINYPRGSSYDRIGREPGMYESYFVREITLNQGMMSNKDYAGNLIVTQEQNDGISGHIAEEGSSYSFHGRSNTTLLQNHGAYSNESGNADPSKFMELKGRKSLFTLLQETKSAFFDIHDRPVYRNPAPGWWRNPVNQSNKYGDNYESYDYQYMATQGPSFVDPPTGIDFTWQAMVGFNLGQTLGGNVTIEDRLRTQAQNITRGLFADLADAAGAADNEFIAAYYNRLAGVFAPVERISQLYVPGWGRPAENWLTKKPLSENLNQNILLPPNSPEAGNPTNVPGNTNDNGQGGPGFGDTTKTFQSLYTRNRAGKSGGFPHDVDGSNPIFNNGMIAGTPIMALQEPKGMTIDAIKAATPPPKTINVPFTFEEDDARYLTYAKRETGFTSNGPTTTTDPSRAEPAVIDLSTMDKGGNPYHLGDSTVKLTQGQYFPFAFSTVNKKRAAEKRFQVCYLQAIINSLGESYTPTWNSRHFFGRSEQAHTYTFTDRTIDISFTIFANEMRQLQNVYERVLWLAQQCYPDYDNLGRMSEGPLVAMRVGDLFQYKAGMIRSLSYDWMFGGGKWEMTSGMRMPQGVTVTMSYQVIHDAIPNRNTDFYGGPAGGLNSATERFREIKGGTNAFDAFEDTETSSLGFGSRLIDSGEQSSNKGEERFLQVVKEANMAWMMDENSQHDRRAAHLSVPGDGLDTNNQQDSANTTDRNFV